MQDGCCFLSGKRKRNSSKPRNDFVKYKERTNAYELENVFGWNFSWSNVHSSQCLPAWNVVENLGHRCWYCYLGIGDEGLQRYWWHYASYGRSREQNYSSSCGSCKKVRRRYV